MYTQDKITRGGEITAAGRFSDGEKPFYIFMVGKTDDSASTSVVTGTLVYGTGDTPFPLVAGIWNPVVFKAVEISQTLLENYRVFWGQEGV